MPRKPYREKLGRLFVLVLVAGGVIGLIRLLDLQGQTGTFVNLIIILSALLFFVLR